MLRGVMAVLLAMTAADATASDRLEAFLGRDPVAEAERAFAAKDRRQIVLPACSDRGVEVLPGWSQQEALQPSGLPTPAFEKAMNEGQRPLSCADFGEDPKHTKFIRAAKHAERYNRRLRELDGVQK